MANYTTDLKIWGATGQEYPDGYSYQEGEQPVDAWDNFFAYHAQQDIDHLVQLTNERIETDYGDAASFPSSPESSHLYYDEENERLNYWDTDAGSWEELVKRSGDTLTGSLSLGSNDINNVSNINFSGGTYRAVDDDGNGNLGIQYYDGSNWFTGLEVNSTWVRANNDLFERTDRVATRTWTNANADVPNADHADDSDAVNGFACVTSGGEALDTPSYATTGDVPALSAGNIVYIEDENQHYFEDGT